MVWVILHYPQNYTHMPSVQLVFPMSLLPPLQSDVFYPNLPLLIQHCLPLLQPFIQVTSFFRFSDTLSPTPFTNIIHQWLSVQTKFSRA